MGSSKASYGAMGMCVMMTMIAIAMMMLGGVAAQGPAAAPPAADCLSVIAQLFDCLPFVTGQAAAPVAACCSNLSSVVASSSAPCLCQLYNTTFTQPLGVNVTQALLLPKACNVTTPSSSICAVSGFPVPGPASSIVPASAPSSMPTPATTPSSIAPSGAAVPSGPPTGMESSNSTASPPIPGSAPHIVAKNFVIVASSLVGIACLLS